MLTIQYITMINWGFNFKLLCFLMHFYIIKYKFASACILLDKYKNESTSLLFKIFKVFFFFIHGEALNYP